MYTKKIALLFFLFSSFSILAQPVEISVKVLQAFSDQAKLYRYTGTTAQLVDSAWQGSPGTYSFFLDSAYVKGLYKINVGKNISFDIVVNNEPVIDVCTVVYAPDDSLKSENSLENRVYWQFEKHKKRHKQHLWLLNSLIDFYPDSASFKTSILKDIEMQELSQNNFANKLASQYPNLLASKFIRLEQKPLHTNLLYPNNMARQSPASKWWGSIDLADAAIVNAPAFSSRLWSYIELFFNDDFDKEEQDSAFISGIEQLMKLDMKQGLKKELRGMLLDGFVDSSYPSVTEFLETNSFGTLPPIRQKSAADLIPQGPRVKVGDKAYNFEVSLKDGSKVYLSDINANYILVIFWSSWCPNCIEALPRVKELYTQYHPKGFEVIAVSLDDEDDLWNSYIKSFGLNWINMREPITIGSELLYMYKVEETPMMFLLSKDLTIISRPATRRQLRARLRKIFN
ncbi:MAG: thioredoxin-like domain-containing protein [Bacteroidales bacterium]|nr:thioredoxin-like domain-containing protein [Bacteroidales bacterium]MDD4384864.1 thioredoxin-like domain-containing protein [Bacteroidales bacterium]MDY0198689.1 thioredoxin-like domain-containing protein [Tenuifilaceae bacterium]